MHAQFLPFYSHIILTDFWLTHLLQAKSWIISNITSFVAYMHFLFEPLKIPLPHLTYVSKSTIQEAFKKADQQSPRQGQ